MEQKNKVVACYCRVASNHQADEATIQNQVAKLRRFAVDQGFGEIVVYEDNGYSGLTLGRPAFRAMDNDIRNGTIRAVVAVDISRIGRGFLLVSDWLDEIEAMGVRAIFVNHPESELQAKLRKSLADAWNRDKESKENF